MAYPLLTPLRKEKDVMPVLSKLHGIIIRMVVDRTFGIHLHGFYDGHELIMALNPARIVQSDAPAWVEAWVLEWGRRNAKQLVSMPQQQRESLRLAHS